MELYVNQQLNLYHYELLFQCICQLYYLLQHQQIRYRHLLMVITSITCIYNRLLLNILYVINQKYGLNL